MIRRKPNNEVQIKISTNPKNNDDDDDNDNDKHEKNKNGWFKTQYEKWKKLQTLKKCLCILIAFALVYVITIFITLISITITIDPQEFFMNSLDSITIRQNDVDYIFEGIEYDERIPPRIFQRSDKLIDHSLMDVTADQCTDFYEYSCGNFEWGKQNEVLEIIFNENVAKREWINRGIVENDELMCALMPINAYWIDKEKSYTNTGCYTALEFYRQCVYDKIHNVSPTKLVNKLIDGLNKVLTIHKKIRYLVENGITNFIHLTREKLDGEEEIWVHYLRPGGVLFPSKTIHLGLYGEEGLKSSQKELTTIGEFLYEMGDNENNNNWIDVFGVHAQRDDLLYVENMGYFKSLNNLLTILPKKEIRDRLKWYIKQDIGYLYGQTCLEQTKLLFPITFCRLFQLWGRHLNDNPPNGIDIAQNVYNYMDDKYDVTTALRVGSCSSLLHSNNLGDYLIKVESQEGIVEHLESMHSLEWAHKYLFKKWYKIYDPVYLFFTYPRILDEQLDDPLDWYSQVNAFYDRFHNEVIVPIGIIQYPLYYENYGMTGDYSRMGFIFGHEISHSIQNTKDLDCLNKKTEREAYEMFADIFGLFNSFEFFFYNDTKSADPCQFFLGYAQTFCSQNPDYKPGGPHGTFRDRVNLSIDFGSRILLNEFNKCFSCKKKEKCKQLKS